MLSSDPTVALRAIRNLVQMEQQNQRDQLTTQPSKKQHVHVHTLDPALRQMSDRQLLERRAQTLEAPGPAKRVRVRVRRPRGS